MISRVMLILLLALVLSPRTFASLYSTGEIKQMVINEANKQGVSPSLALAIAKVESNFNPEALSHAGAKGVMQIMPKTAEDVFSVSRYRLFNPQVNIALGVKFIKQLINSYNGRVDIALSHYNGGSKVKDRWGNLRVNPVTENYVNKVFMYQKRFEKFDQDFMAPTQSLLANSGIDRVSKLKEIQLHNLTRNLTTQLSFGNSYPKQSNLVSKKWLDKRAKVAEWESIYTD